MDVHRIVIGDQYYLQVSFGRYPICCVMNDQMILVNQQLSALTQEDALVLCVRQKKGEDLLSLPCLFYTSPPELGDHVRKPFFQCSGREILREVLLHLGLEAHLAAIEADCVQAWPVLLPYAQAAKLAENDPVLHSAKLAHTNFAVLSPYARCVSETAMRQVSMN